MGCHSPIGIRTPEKDGVPGRRVLVPCGRCVGCLSRRRAEWTFRLLQEERTSSSSAFVTLTYNDEYLPHVRGVSTLWKPDLQKYLKRVRSTGAPIKYYACGEYGLNNTLRPHYHIILFNSDEDTIVEKWSEDGVSMGRVSVDKCETASIHYCTKYLLNSKSQGYKKRVKPFALMSKGLGKDYVEKAKAYHKAKGETLVVFPGGQKVAMPRYYKNKIYTEDELRQIGETNLEKIQETLKKIDYDREMARRKGMRERARRAAK